MLNRGLFIDPGTVKSGYVIYDGYKVYESGVVPNEVLENWLEEKTLFDIVGIEQIEARGNRLGKETIDTIQWTGIFKHAAKPKTVLFAPPSKVRHFLCGRPNSSDKAVTEALVARCGDKIKVWRDKKNKDGHLLTSHAIQAFALAVYLLEKVDD